MLITVYTMGKLHDSYILTKAPVICACCVAWGGSQHIDCHACQLIITPLVVDVQLLSARK